MIEMAAPVIETTGDANFMSGMAICMLAALWFVVDFYWHQRLSGLDMTIRFVGIAVIVMSGWSAIDPSSRYSGFWVGLFFTAVMMAVTFAFKRGRQPGIRMNND